MKPAQVNTPSEVEVEVIRSFDAPLEPVWQAFTEPELVRRWMLGPAGWTMPVCEMDVRPGGKYRWRWRNEEDGSEFGFFGEFREIEPHVRIVHVEIYESGSDMGEETLVTTTFQETNGITTVRTLIRYASKEDCDAALATGMTDGMEMGYARLDDLFVE
jgi:uncharacterized protein YndB with AHSA1/START domain